MTAVYPTKEETIRSILLEALRYRGVKVYDLVADISGWSFCTGTLKTESLTLDTFINRPGPYTYGDVLDQVISQAAKDELHNPRQVARFRNDIPVGLRKLIGPELVRMKIDFWGIPAVKKIVVKEIDSPPAALVATYADLVNRAKLSSRVSGISEMLEAMDYSHPNVGQRCLLNWIHDISRMF